MEVWTRAKWEAAKLRWEQDHEKFSECAGTLHKQTSSKYLSLHDQRHFMYDCMNEGRPSPFATSATVARVKSWTVQQWNAGKDSWNQSHAKFSDCSGKLKELLAQRKLSRHDEREFLVHCMSEPT